MSSPATAPRMARRPAQRCGGRRPARDLGSANEIADRHAPGSLSVRGDPRREIPASRIRRGAWRWIANRVHLPPRRGEIPHAPTALQCPGVPCSALFFPIGAHKGWHRYDKLRRCCSALIDAQLGVGHHWRRAPPPRWRLPSAGRQWQRGGPPLGSGLAPCQGAAGWRRGGRARQRPL